MRVLWLCNIMLPMIAETLHMEASNKEGWLSGLLNTCLRRQAENVIELAVAFPVTTDLSGAERVECDENVVFKGTVKQTKGNGQAANQRGGLRGASQGNRNGCLQWFAFLEDTANPHIYDRSLESAMKHIAQDFQPDVVHCFGTEYPHTLAMCRAFPHKNRILIGIQGLCRVYADAYFADLPEHVIHTVTLRDFLKRDSLTAQRDKYVLRGAMEYEAVQLAGNVTGRTAWDKYYTAKWNPQAQYFEMNETLRPDFYAERQAAGRDNVRQWSLENCEPHSIFLSQGDYPIKGLHYMLLALPKIRDKFPDVKVYVAGNSVIGGGSPMKRVKISAYGKYLRGLIRKYGLEGQICFLGRLSAEQMKQRYLGSNLFVCCSSIENSPNSLGEAMILGVPCVSADVGGISSIFTDGEDGILYKGYDSNVSVGMEGEDGEDGTRLGLNGQFSSEVGQTTVGQTTVGQTTVGQTTVGQTTVGQTTVGQTAVGQTAVGQTAVGQTAVGRITVGQGKVSLQENTRNLSDAVIRMFQCDAGQLAYYTQNACKHAMRTHDPERNYAKLMEIYEAIGKRERSAGRRGFVFVSNYINHHQIPFCGAMRERLGEAFVFIQTEPMEEERVRMGWQAQTDLDYVKYYYEEPEECERLIDTAAVVFFGGVDEEGYIRRRLAAGKPVIRYSERLYKQGQWRAVSPRGLWKKYHDHTRYRKALVWLMCAGAYVPSDFHIVGAYPGKMFKWGYFPQTRHYDLDRLMQDKKPGTILWAARFLDWKHPESALMCAAYLKEKGYSFHMNIVGGGQMQPLVDRLMREFALEKEVTLLGFQKPEEVRRLMEQSDIYLATSDRKEGWGAVVNEAMNSGCAVVADHMMGAVPYLIRPGKNGFVYRDGKLQELYGLVEGLLVDRELCRQLGRAAYHTITEVWNAETAAERLLDFCAQEGIYKAGDGARIGGSARTGGGGPCSPAPVISERKMLWEMNRKEGAGRL